MERECPYLYKQVVTNSNHGFCDQPAKESLKAYSKLIAAAPELLEACERALQWMINCERETGKPMGEGLGYKGRMQKAIVANILFEAIGKARGK